MTSRKGCTNICLCVIRAYTGEAAVSPILLGHHFFLSLSFSFFLFPLFELLHKHRQTLFSTLARVYLKYLIRMPFC